MGAIAALPVYLLGKTYMLCTSARFMSVKRLPAQVVPFVVVGFVSTKRLIPIFKKSSCIETCCFVYMKPSLFKRRMFHRGLLMSHRDFLISHRGLLMSHRGVLMSHRGFLMSHRGLLMSPAGFLMSANPLSSSSEICPGPLESNLLESSRIHLNPVDSIRI
jgi:hypothetical protein